MSNQVRANSAFSTLPFDQIDGIPGFFIHDDFIGTSTAASNVAQSSANNWRVGTSATGLVALAGVADHPGIVQLAATGVLYPGGSGTIAQAPIVLDDNGSYWAAVVRITDIDDQDVFIGFSDSTTDAINNPVAGWLYDGSALEHYVTSEGGGNDVEIVHPIVENEWVLVEVAASNSDVLVRVTTENARTVQQLPAVNTVAVYPVIDTHSDPLDIDLVHFRYLRRDALVGLRNDWLGA